MTGFNPASRLLRCFRHRLPEPFKEQAKRSFNLSLASVAWRGCARFMGAPCFLRTACETGARILYTQFHPKHELNLYLTFWQFFLELWEELQTRTQKAQQSSSNKSLTGTMNVAEVASVISSAVVSGDDDGALFDETAGAYKHLRTRTEEMIVELLVGNMKEELKAYSRMLVFTVSSP